MAFEAVAEMMAEMAVFHLFFPWLLVLAASYGILQKTEVFGDDPSINGAVALSLAFLTIGGAYLFLPEGIFTNFVGVLAFGIFGLLGLMLVLAMAGVDLEELGQGSTPATVGTLIVAIAFLGVISVHVDVLGLIGVDMSDVRNALGPAAVLIFMALVVYWTVSNGGGD